LALWTALLLGMLSNAAMAGLYAVGPSLYPTAVRATGMGCAIGIGRLGAILAPFASGALLDRGWEAQQLYGLFSGPFAIAAMAMLLVGSRPAPPAPRTVPRPSPGSPPVPPPGGGGERRGAGSGGGGGSTTAARAGGPRPRARPGRKRFIARERSYHGNTLGALSVSGFRERRRPFEGSLLDVSFVSAANAYRPLRGLAGEQLVAALADELDASIRAAGPERV